MTVTSGIDSLNHTAIAVREMREAEAFYTEVLGAEPYGCTSFCLEDVKTGSAVFKSYVIGDFLLALTVARSPLAMPPAGQLRGAHGFRHGFQVSRARFAETLALLKERGIPFQGPVDHPEAGPFGQSVYFKDPSGNFLELSWRRDEDTLPRERSYVSPE